MTILFHIIAAAEAARAADGYLGACTLYWRWVRKASSSAGVVVFGPRQAAPG
jgi:hypothetical protein